MHFVKRLLLSLAPRYGLLAVVALFTTFPFLWTLATSLGDSGNIYAFPPQLWPENPTFAHMQEARRAIPLDRFFWNSVWISGWTVAGTLLISALAGYALAIMRFRGSKWVFAAVLATLILPSELNFIVNFITVTQLKLTNTHTGVVLPLLANAFGIFLLKQAFEEIPAEVLDAARIDGATEWQLFLRVALPLAMPALAALGIFTLVATWNTYIWPAVVLQNPDEYPLAVGVLYLSGTFAAKTRVVAAGTVLTILPVLLLFLMAQRYFMRGLDGAVK
ncbi:carbohydrate ABC transporter permease [Chitiniphilus purpureus]|uniref:Carbohydrate ABC transporter permease n=1 Tax=Chitiniphilus purpureus TaxID=2981137 RepID=A0ABY6DLG0_9NEIS|nr:carbohydrate ABC transporter permease [Chitiniphilus sp. CD1]UXY15190.1 carbohydrate ABC transporter permease [Chitiniphilus sp. CD1]